MKKDLKKFLYNLRIAANVEVVEMVSLLCDLICLINLIIVSYFWEKPKSRLDSSDYIFFIKSK